MILTKYTDWMFNIECCTFYIHVIQISANGWMVIVDFICNNAIFLVSQQIVNILYTVISMHGEFENSNGTSVQKSFERYFKQYFLVTRLCQLAYFIGFW